MRPDGQNVYGVTTFNVNEVNKCMRQPGPARQILSRYSGEDVKFIVLNIRRKYGELLKEGKLFLWNKWLEDANLLMAC